MNKPILIADDHPLFREALTYIVSSVMPETEIETATNYAETWEKLGQESFGMVFLDLNMPDSNGLADLALIKKSHPSTPIVIVSAHEEAEIVQTCLDYNASGYIIKSSSPDEIKAAITTINEGNVYVPPSVDLSSATIDSAGKAANAKIDSLTPSQLKVLIEMGKGKLNKQIAYDLEISEATVKAHITTVFKKLNINNRTQAVLFIKEHPELKTTLG